MCNTVALSVSRLGDESRPRNSRSRWNRLGKVVEGAAVQEEGEGWWKVRKVVGQVSEPDIELFE